MLMDAIGHEVSRFDGFTLDRRHRCLRAGERVIELRPRSFDVLVCLVERAGRLVSKDELIEAVWPNVVVTDESLTRCICDVRRALGDGEQEIIKTLPRRGYLFAASVEQEPVGLRSDEAAAHPDPVTLAGSRDTVGDGTVARHRVPGVRRWWSILAGIVVLLTALASGARWLLQPVGPPGSDRPSVAVLPLVNLSGDPGQDYFSDGISEDLTVSLSKFGTFSVIARSSAFQYKGAAIDARQIGQMLGARYLVQGSVRRDPERVRISVQLVDATTGWQLWAERYDSEPGGIFAIQDEVTQRIVTTLVARIDRAEIEHALR
jgi:adenylate cyclase